MAFYSLSLYSLNVAGRGFVAREVRQDSGKRMQFNDKKGSFACLCFIVNKITIL
jgi:hypothetical protein